MPRKAASLLSGATTLRFAAALPPRIVHGERAALCAPSFSAWAPLANLACSGAGCCTVQLRWGRGFLVLPPPCPVRAIGSRWCCAVLHSAALDATFSSLGTWTSHAVRTAPRNRSPRPLTWYCPADGVSLSGSHQKPRLCRVVVGISFVLSSSPAAACAVACCPSLLPRGVSWARVGGSLASGRGRSRSSGSSSRPVVLPRLSLLLRPLAFLALPPSPAFPFALLLRRLAFLALLPFSRLPLRPVSSRGLLLCVVPGRVVGRSRVLLSSLSACLLLLW